MSGDDLDRTLGGSTSHGLEVIPEFISCAPGIIDNVSVITDALEGSPKAVSAKLTATELGHPSTPDSCILRYMDEDNNDAGYDGDGELGPFFDGSTNEVLLFCEDKVEIGTGLPVFPITPTEDPVLTEDNIKN